MAASMKPALFRFQIRNRLDITEIEHSHPVPAFLCKPATSQKDSQAWKDAFIDVISVITNQHHDECMQAITTPCISCQQPAKDALKTPMSALHLIPPIVVVSIDPVCGSNVCDMRTRQYLARMQEETMREGKEHEKRMFRKMSCKVCGKENAKRCSGCGQVAYCGRDCQKEHWKVHRPVCARKNLKEVAGSSALPYEEI